MRASSRGESCQAVECTGGGARAAYEAAPRAGVDELGAQGRTIDRVSARMRRRAVSTLTGEHSAKGSPVCGLQSWGLACGEQMGSCLLHLGKT